MKKSRDWPIGRTIVAVEQSDPQAVKDMMWPRPGVVLRLDDGSTLEIWQDEEGNGPGVLMGVDGDDFFVLIQPGRP